MDVVEAYYRLEPFLRSAVHEFVREHLDTYAETDEGGHPKEFWCSFYNLEVRFEFCCFGGCWVERCKAVSISRFISVVHSRK